MNKKIAIVGAGQVGAVACYTICAMGFCDEIVLYDIDSDIAKGKAIDIQQSTAFFDKPTSVSYAKNINELTNCDIVIITAGVPRKGEMSRDDLLLINANIMKDIVKNITISSPKALLLCVSNPLDVMTYVVYRLSGWHRSRVIGMAGALDSARMSYEIAKHTKTNINQIKTMIIGEHGKNMISIFENSLMNQKNLFSSLNEKQQNQIINNTKNGGANIVKYLKTSAYFAPGCATAKTAQAILTNKNIVLPCSMVLDGEYDTKDVAIGVPVKFGDNKANKIVKLKLDTNTKIMFEKAVLSIKESIDTLNKHNFFD